MRVGAQAHETGICAIREELYSQCFDEVRRLAAPGVGMPQNIFALRPQLRPGTAQVIRQVTVGCAERGLLLLRLRDEMRMTLTAYQARACAQQAAWSCWPVRQWTTSMLA